MTRESSRRLRLAAAALAVLLLLPAQCVSGAAGPDGSVRVLMTRLALTSATPATKQ